VATVFYVEHDGTRHEVEVPVGTSVMKGALFNSVPGIDGDCGGACACATCHVFVPEPWQTITGIASPNEREMLECASDVTEASRLGCQIIITQEMNGLEVRMPRSQG
jgi:2Fe-2S ferredoxin